MTEAEGRYLGNEAATAAGIEVSARTLLEDLREVLQRYGLSMEARIGEVLADRDMEVEVFLLSSELWGRAGSIVYRAGSARFGGAQREIEEAFRALGEWQIAQGYVNQDVRSWVGFYRSRRGLPPLLGAPVLDGQDALAERARRDAVPWSLRDVWLGVVAMAVILGGTWGLVRALRELLPRADLDVWGLIITILVELLFLVPVWWFAIYRRHASLKTLGLVRFRFQHVPVGFGLLVGVYVVNAAYAVLLDSLGVRVEAEQTPLSRSPSVLVLLLLAMVVVAPLVEETFFRGFVFAGMRSRHGWVRAAVISALVFAAAHLDLLFFIPRFLLGYLFAFIYDRSRSLWPSMILHAAWNGFALTVTYLVS